MSVLLNHPCMSEEDFHDYAKELEAVKGSDGYRHVHYGVRPEWTWPALIVTIVEFSRDTENPRNTLCSYAHTSLSQKRLLKVLGLSQAEIKMEFNALPVELTPESFENREV